MWLYQTLLSGQGKTSDSNTFWGLNFNLYNISNFNGHLSRSNCYGITPIDCLDWILKELLDIRKWSILAWTHTYDEVAEVKLRYLQSVDSLQMWAKCMWWIALYNVIRREYSTLSYDMSTERGQCVVCEHWGVSALYGCMGRVACEWWSNKNETKHNMRITAVFTTCVRWKMNVWLNLNVWVRWVDKTYRWWCLLV